MARFIISEEGLQQVPSEDVHFSCISAAVDYAEFMATNIMKAMGSGRVRRKCDRIIFEDREKIVNFFVVEI